MNLIITDPTNWSHRFHPRATITLEAEPAAIPPEQKIILLLVTWTRRSDAEEKGAKNNKAHT